MINPPVHRHDPVDSPEPPAPNTPAVHADDELRRRAVARIEAKQGLVTHLVVYVAVNAML